VFGAPSSEEHLRHNSPDAHKDDPRSPFFLDGNAPLGLHCFEQQHMYGRGTLLKMNVSPKCRIMLMDPSRKIFEIVAVP
jgi:hypothetical protein